MFILKQQQQIGNVLLSRVKPPVVPVMIYPISIYPVTFLHTFRLGMAELTLRAAIK